MQLGKAAAKQRFNQFILSAIVIASLHLGYILSQTEHTGLGELLPLAIDSTLLLGVFGMLFLSTWFIQKLPFGRTLASSGLLSTLISFLLGFGVLAVLLYSAYTGDRFNITLADYFIHHAAELSAPIVAETGYLPLFAVGALVVVAGFTLHLAHRLSARHMILIFLLSVFAILLTNAFASQKNIRIYTFFSPIGNPDVVNHAEEDLYPTPPWFKSLYLTLFGWDHAAYKQEENAVPYTQYSFPGYVGQNGRRPNFLIIALESVRASATSPYSNSPEIHKLTPNLQRLAESGLLVEHAYTTVPHTSKALVGIFCGQFPRKEIEITEAEPNGIPGPCIPELLEHAGYQTAFFQSALGEFEKRHNLTGNMGFAETVTQEQLPDQSYMKLSYVGMDDYAMLDPAISWMKEQAKYGKPFFAGMLTVVTHHPYATPNSKTVLRSNDAADLKQAYSLYLEAVAYTDHFIGDLIHRLEQAGLMENTIVIITGDDGEAFAEHGLQFHNGTPHEEGMKVPLLLYSPSQFPSPKRIRGLRSHLDIFPTIFELSGIKLNKGLPGKSLLTSGGMKHFQARAGIGIIAQCSLKPTARNIFTGTAANRMSITSFDMIQKKHPILFVT